MKHVVVEAFELVEVEMAVAVLVSELDGLRGDVIDVVLIEVLDFDELEPNS